MNLKSNLLMSCLFVGLLFVGMGDNFLPEPLSNVSSNTRSSVNQFLMGLFPDKEPINANERTEKVIDKLEEKY